jgi:hypothetical protein
MWFRNASQNRFHIAIRRIEHLVQNRCKELKPLPRYPITCEIDGKTHKGTYWVAEKILTVSTGLGARANRLEQWSSNAWAKQLLLELIKAGKA